MVAEKSPEKTIRVGVVGVGRGMSFARSAAQAGMELVALCDTWEERLIKAGEDLGVATYTDFARFLEHDMDAVILANFFHEHAPFAIQALAAGKHVMSETSACKTLAEGVALCRAVEASGLTYMIAENYCFFTYNQEMRRLYAEGEIGNLVFGECEYIHAFDSNGYNRLAPGMNHWRNWLPTTYYCTHALAPVMFITETRPVSVNAKAAPHSLQPIPGCVKRRDPTATIMTTMDTGALVLINGLGLQGHGNWYRLHGNKGLMENLRSYGEQHKLRIVHENWTRAERQPREVIYEPEFPIHADLAKRAGHGGGDFFTNWHFADAIRTGQKPFLDVYRAVDMTITGIQAWKSCLADGAPQPVPDFRHEAVRKEWENDHFSPFPEDHDKQENPPPPSIEGFIDRSPADIAAARAAWDDMGYHGQ